MDNPLSPKPAESKSAPLSSLDKQPAEIRDILADIPEESRQKLVAVLQAKSEVFQGPFPHPKHVAKYEELCPNFLERSLTMAEKAQAANIESRHLQLENARLALENEQQKIQMQKHHDILDSQDTRRAQYLGFIALVVLAAIAAFLAVIGHERIAEIMFGAAVIGFLGKIFIGKFSKRSS